MADLRVTQLPPLLESELESGDPLLVADVSASESKKITPVALFEGSAKLVGDGTIPSSKLAYPLPAQVVDNQAIADNTIQAVKIAPDSLTALQIAPNAIGASELADGSVDNAAILANSVTGGSLGSLALNTVTNDNMASDSVTANALANLAVDTEALQQFAVTGGATGKIAADTIDDFNIVPGGISRISYPLPPGVIDTQAIGDQQITAIKIEPDTITALQVAPNAIGASELADGSVDNAAIQANAVTGGSLGSLALNTVTAQNMASDSVNANALADLSVDTAALQQFAVTGGSTGKTAADTINDFNIVPDGIGRIADDSIGASQIIDRTITSEKIVLGNVTPAELASDLPGSILAADTITSREIGPDAIEASEISPLAVDRGLDKSSGQIGHTNQITAATLSGIDYDENGHVIGASVDGILSTELPPATDTELGGVSIPSTSGLVVNASGELNHASTVGASTVSGFTFNESGHIVDAEPLEGDDLPPATDISLGGVSVPGPTVVVDAAGAIAHSVSGVTAGQYPLVTVDAEGHVIAGDVLAPSDIPGLDAAKIVSGTFPTEQLTDRSVTQRKLADYSVSFIQEDMPTPDPGGPAFHNGCLWFQESTGQLNMWNGNSWMPVARGALASQNLRWGGGIDASTGLCVFLTDFGVSAGLKVGSPLPAASNNIGGLYLVVTASGALIDVDAVRGTTFDSGDWVLAVDEVTGWIRVDVNDGAGGGGGGASFLDGLNDVTITTPQNGEVLAYNGTAAQWENRMAINWVNLAAAGPGVVSYATTNGGELIACTEIDGGNY